MIDPRVETIQNMIGPVSERKVRERDAALLSLAREALLGRFVVEAAERVERRGNPMGILGPVLVALDNYRAEFPQEPT